MKKVFITLFSIGLLLFPFSLFSAFRSPEKSKSSFKRLVRNAPEADLKKEAFEVLRSKCNLCHKKRNPFKVFSLKNMDRHAPKIYQQVFVKRRMPKGNKVKLTDQEYQTLKEWLKQAAKIKSKDTF